MAYLIIDFLLPLLLCEEVREVRVSIHVVVDVGNAPIFEVNPVHQQIVFVGMVDQRKLWRCLQLALKQEEMVPCVLISRLIFVPKLAKLAIS